MLTRQDSGTEGGCIDVYPSLLLLLFLAEIPKLGVCRNYKFPNNLSP